MYIFYVLKQTNVSSIIDQIKLVLFLLQDESGSAGSDSDIFDEVAKNKLDSSSEVDEVPITKVVANKNTKPKKAVIESDGEDGNADIIIDSDSEDAIDIVATKDDFDVSDSDDGGFAWKIKAQVKSQVKKPPPKKLTTSSDLFTNMMAAGSEPKKTLSKKVSTKKPSAAAVAKKAPAPSKKTSAAPARKKKHSSSADDEKPAKKSKSVKKNNLDSESGSDFADGPAPPPREKAGGGGKNGDNSFNYNIFYSQEGQELL